MGGLVVDPVPGSGNGRVGGHAQVLLGGGSVVDRRIETCDDDGADAVRAAVLDRGAGGGVEIDGGLVVRRQGGEARGLAGRHAAGSARGDGHGVRAPIAELAGRMPSPLVACQDAGNRLAGVVDHRDVVKGSGEGGDGHGCGGVDVLAARARPDPQRGGLGGRPAAGRTRSARRWPPGTVRGTGRRSKRHPRRAAPAPPPRRRRKRRERDETRTTALQCGSAWAGTVRSIPDRANDKPIG